MAEDGEERAHRGKDVDGEVGSSGAQWRGSYDGLWGPWRWRRCSGGNGEDDGETTASGVSWYRDEARLELGGAAALSWARTITVTTEIIRKLRPYQETQIFVASLVVKSEGRGCPGAPTISRRSCARGHKNRSGGCVRKPEAVWSKREGPGVALSHRNHRRRSSVSVGRGAWIEAAWRPIERGKGMGR
jgi:hypothetical protein